MHLNINFSGAAGQTHFHRPGFGSQIGMMRMMMQLMQQMLSMFMGQSQGCHCPCGRPNFGGSFGHPGGRFGAPVAHRGGGSPVGNFLGSQGGCHSPGGGYHGGGYSGGQAHGHCPAPGPVGNWQSAGCQGEWGSRLPGPLQRYSGAFEQYGRQYGVDPKFLAAISMLETGSGTSKAFRYKNNAMGVSNASGPIAFGSVEQSIERMARVLAKQNGPYAGKQTIGQIAGVYCPVGAGNDVNGTNHHWPSMVSKFYARLGGDPSAAVKA